MASGPFLSANGTPYGSRLYGSGGGSGSDLAIAGGLVVQQDTLAQVTSTAENGGGAYAWTLTDPAGVSQTSRLSATDTASVTWTPYNGLDDDKWLAGNWIAACTDGTITVKHAIQIGTDSGHILHDWTTRVVGNTNSGSEDARDSGNEDFSTPTNPTLAINGSQKVNMYQAGTDGFCSGFTSPICTGGQFDDFKYSAYSIILVTDADEIADADSSQNGVYAGICGETTFTSNGIACGVDRTNTGVIRAVSCKMGSARNTSGAVQAQDPQRFEGLVLRFEPEGSSIWALQIVNAQDAAGLTTDAAVQTSINKDFGTSPMLFCGLGTVAGGMGAGWTQALKVYYQFYPQYDGPSS
jgi:hypothetical protein